ncbi:MAG: hypothetical protein EBS53_00715 [Bacteroidetes bacterium]|nr:hypothetical protein [Bacteroidota bacterium]
MNNLARNDITIPRPAFHALLGQDFKSYVKWCFIQLKGQDAFDEAPYIDYICDRMQIILDQPRQRLLVSLPPRYLKSYLLTIFLPTWLLGHFPQWKVVIVSYSQEVAEEKGRACLQLMQSEGYRQIFPHVQISSAKNAAGEFETTVGGGVLCTSIGGAITGRGADVILIDDPVKAQDANSPHILKKVLDFFNNSAITRLNDKKQGIVIVNMQRLAVNDLVGALKENPEFETIAFPVIAEQDETFHFSDGRVWHRKRGDLLNPKREPLEVLEKQKQIMGEPAFMAQYMQRPLMASTQLLSPRSFRYYHELPPAPGLYINSPPRRLLIISVDSAFKAGAQNDYTGISVGAVVGNMRQSHYYILEILRRRYAFGEVLALLKSLGQQYKQLKLGNIQFWIEDSANGPALYEMLKADGWNVKLIPVTNSKEARLREYLDVFENGQVFLPEKAAWLKDFLDEAYSFPTGEYDDRVDALVQMIKYQSTYAVPRIRQL